MTTETTETTETKTEMTAREKIAKYCAVVREAGEKGVVLTFGKRRYRMSQPLEKMTDADCERVFKYLELDSYIAKCGATAAKRRGGKSGVGKPEERKPCECGCGRIAKAGRKFLPGHDAKLKSALRKTVAKGGRASAKAKAELERRGW